MKLSESIDGLLDRLTDELGNWSRLKKILVLVIIWALLFIPPVLHHSLSLKDEHYYFFPEESAPEGFKTPDWNVTYTPQENLSGDGITFRVKKGEQVEFRWSWLKEKRFGIHIGAVNVFYEMKGERGIVRLNELNSSSSNKTWEGEKTFHQNGEVTFHFRVEMTDIPIFNRRASIIADGGNPYEETWTGPPPLINFLFIPAAAIAPSVQMGGAFLSFNLYFALFLLLDSLLIYGCFRERDEENAYLASLIFLANPVTVLTMHQDEPLVAFLLILPLYLYVKKRKKGFPLAVGVGAVAKVWTGFWVPVMLTLRDERWKKRLGYVTVSIAAALGLLLLFRLAWGPDVLWFLKFYGGGASKSNVGGISFWSLGLQLFEINNGLLPVKAIMALIGILGLYLIWLSEKGRWSGLSLITVLLALFLALYPKVHWEYFLLLFSFLTYFSTEGKFFLIFYTISIAVSLSMVIKSADGSAMIAASLLCSLAYTILLFLTIYFIEEREGTAEKGILPKI